jgi:hypothetical protein
MPKGKHSEPESRAAAERAGGKFSHAVARRVFECELVRELVGGATENRRVAGGVQRGGRTAAWAIRRRGLCAATRSVRRLRPGSRATPPDATPQNRDSHHANFV